MLRQLIEEGHSLGQNPEHNFADTPMWVNQNIKMISLDGK